MFTPDKLWPEPWAHRTTWTLRCKSPLLTTPSETSRWFKVSSQRTALHSPWQQLGVIPREKSVFYLKAWRDSSHILADFVVVVVFSGRSRREGGGSGSVWPFKKLAEPLKGTRGSLRVIDHLQKTGYRKKVRWKKAGKPVCQPIVLFCFYLERKKLMEGKQPAAESYLLSQDTSLFWSLVKHGVGVGVLLLTGMFPV